MIVLGLVLACAISNPTSAQEEQPPSSRADQLLGRIREMRKSLLLGGDKVQQAEAEAIDFYGEKIERIDQRLDTVQADLSEKRAAYDVALDSALGSEGASSRAGAMKNAQTLRNEISVLERDAEDLNGKRRSVSGLVRAVEARGHERRVLSQRMETSLDLDAQFGLSIGGVGLAPPVEVQPIASPFDDEPLVQDLLTRDPRGARQLLFEADPQRYWERFPLKPPADALRAALAFPLPDLPGSR